MLYLEDLNIGDQFKSREYEMTLEEIKESTYTPELNSVSPPKTKPLETHVVSYVSV